MTSSTWRALSRVQAASFFAMLAVEFEPGLYVVKLTGNESNSKTFDSFIDAENTEIIYELACKSNLKWSDIQPTGSGLNVFLLQDDTRNNNVHLLLPTGLIIKTSCFIKKLMKKTEL